MLLLYDNSRAHDLRKYLDRSDTNDWPATLAEGLAVLELIDSILIADKILVADFERSFRDAECDEDKWSSTKTLRDLRAMCGSDAVPEIERLKIGFSNENNTRELFERALTHSATLLSVDIPHDLETTEARSLAAFPDCLEYREERDQNLRDLIFSGTHDTENHILQCFAKSDGVAECLLLRAPEIMGKAQRTFRQMDHDGEDEERINAIVAAFGARLRMAVNTGYATLASEVHNDRCVYMPAPARGLLAQKTRKRSLGAVSPSLRQIFKNAKLRWSVDSTARRALDLLEQTTSASFRPCGAVSVVRSVNDSLANHSGRIDLPFVMKEAARNREKHRGAARSLRRILQIRRQILEGGYNDTSDLKNELLRILKAVRDPVSRETGLSSFKTTVLVGGLSGASIAFAWLISYALDRPMDFDQMCQLGELALGTLGVTKVADVMATKRMSFAETHFGQVISEWAEIQGSDLADVWMRLGVDPR